MAITEDKPAPVRPALRRWLKMGIELEGGWETDYRVLSKKALGAAAKTDQSIEPSPGWNFYGEITTRPHDTLDGIIADLDVLYPDYTNVSCGFHVHVSFTPMDVTILTDARFWNYFRSRMERWGHATNQKDEFWERFHGSVPQRARRYMPTWKPEEQLVMQKDRYTQLNFISWHKYKTIECRLFPMWRDKEVAKLAIRELSDIYDTYLNDNNFPEIKLEVRPKTAGAFAVEEYKVKMPERQYWEERARLENKRVVIAPGVDYAFPTASGLYYPSTAVYEDQEL